VTPDSKHPGAADNGDSSTTPKAARSPPLPCLRQWPTLAFFFPFTVDLPFPPDIAAFKLAHEMSLRNGSPVANRYFSTTCM